MTGTPVAGFIVIPPRVQVKAVKGHTLLADANLRYIRPHFRVEAVAVHAEVGRRIPETNDPGCDAQNGRPFGVIRPGQGRCDAGGRACRGVVDAVVLGLSASQGWSYCLHDTR